MARPEEYVTYEIRPNLPLLGKKYGRQVPAIRAALAGADAAEIARAAAAGEAVPVTLADGTSLTLSSEELLVDTRQRGGFAVAEEGGYVVALETELTPELRREGLSRDFVRLVQDARKSADLRIEDRIRVAYSAVPDGEIAATVVAFGAFIVGETLADELRAGEPETGAFAVTTDAKGQPLTLGGEPFSFGIVRAGA